MFFRSIFGFKGRISRRWWWYGQLIIFLILAIIVATALIMNNPNQAPAQSAELNSADAAFIALLLGGLFISIVINVCSTVQRYHDRNKSAWWFLIIFVPFGSLWQLIECGFCSGDEHTNDYGPSPGESRQKAALLAELTSLQPAANGQIKAMPPVVSNNALRQSQLMQSNGKPSFGRRT